MKIYHGSDQSIEKPEIRISKFTKDFGVGFYCTEIKDQAERWSLKYDTPTVSAYEYAEDLTLNILKFDRMTDEWLDFIVNCRSGKSHKYDIVIGAMADDQVYNYIADFINEKLSREDFWVLAKFKYSTHQIVFCSDKSLKCIKFIKSEEVKSDVQRIARRK